MSVPKEGGIPETLVVDPYKVFNNGKITNKKAIQNIVKQMRRQRLNTIDYVNLYDMYLQAIVGSDIFYATCCAQMMQAFKVEFPMYETVTMGQWDKVMAKYFK